MQVIPTQTKSLYFCSRSYDKTDGQKDRQTNRYSDRQTKRQVDRQTDSQTDRQTVRQTVRQTDRQTNRKVKIEGPKITTHIISDLHSYDNCQSIKYGYTFYFWSQDYRCAELLYKIHSYCEARPFCHGDDKFDSLNGMKNLGLFLLSFLFILTHRWIPFVTNLTQFSANTDIHEVLAHPFYLVVLFWNPWEYSVIYYKKICLQYSHVAML